MRTKDQLLWASQHAVHIVDTIGIARTVLAVGIALFTVRVAAAAIRCWRTALPVPVAETDSDGRS